MKVSAKDLQRIIREELQIIEMWPWRAKKPVVGGDVQADDPFNTDPPKHYPRSEVDPNKKYPSLRHAPRSLEDQVGNELGNKQALSYMNGLGVMTLRHFMNDIEKWMDDPRDTGAMPSGDPRLNAIIYMGKLDPKKRISLYNTAVATAEAREEEEMTRRGRDPRTGELVIYEGVDLWNRIVGPRGDANSGTGYALQEGYGSDGTGGLFVAHDDATMADEQAARRYLQSLTPEVLSHFLDTLGEPGDDYGEPDDDYTDPSDIVSEGAREVADEKRRQDAADYDEYIASLGSDEELPHPFASSGEEEETETYGLHRGYGSRRPR